MRKLAHLISVGCFAFGCLVLGAATADGADLSSLRLNQIQVIGTHNSYHVAPSPEALALMGKVSVRLQKALDYTHRPLAEQFGELGIRQIELDLFADPDGGLYARFAVLPDAAPAMAKQPDYLAAMRRPGLKVFHVQDVDQGTTVPTFVDALVEVRDWLRANPDKGPILVLVEMKDDRPAPMLTQPLPFGVDELAAVDAEIASVFDRNEVIHPEDVQGDAPSLREAVLGRGWPTIAACRGKVFFKIDNAELSQRCVAKWRQLAGRSLFPDLPPDHPCAAIMNRNNPVGGFKEIQSLVRQGFLVRTRADSETRQARTGDTSRRDRALASGAQFVSTDYPEPDTRLSDYAVRLPGGQATRPNPIIGHDDRSNPSRTD